MMSGIPARLNRIAMAFDEAAKATKRLCESSGSEQSPKDSTDLSDLVNSFFERDCEDQEKEKQQEQDDSDGYWSESETKHTLLNLLRYAHAENQEEDLKQKVRKEIEHACEMTIGYRSSEDFKRQLMSHLRNKGFDAGLCKSRWEKLGRYLLAGNYEYVDVNINGTRYIVEVNLAGQFEIARPTTSYASLLEVIPPIFIGTPIELKQIVKLICKAMRESMKRGDMHMPPWRRSGYMQSKWFARYRRTVDQIPAPINASQFNGSVSARSKRPVGFEAMPTISFHCKDNFSSKAGLKVGYLAAAFNGTS